MKIRQQQRHCRGKMRTSSSIATLTFLVFFIFTIFSTSQIKNVNAKEIEATDEWQIVAEGDTIPAGLHVKMDLETGTKWVKLLKDDEGSSTAVLAMDEANDGDVSIESEGRTYNIKKDVKITQLPKDAKASPEQAQKITSQLLKQAQEEEKRKQNFAKSIFDLNDFENDASIDESDYESMYRSLLSLPEEDKKNMNLPEHPFGFGVDIGEDEGKKAELDMFIRKVKEIWNERQEVLKRLEEEFLANIPDIIRDKITFLNGYVSSPLKHLKAITENSQDNNQDANEGGDMNIIETLEDLEYHLMDLDNARDFHIMGGWPLLVSLLTDGIHRLDQVLQNIITAQNFTEVPHNNEASEKIMVELPEAQQLYIQSVQEAIWDVQSVASWCIGTAVKNIDEFQPWALEDLSDYLQYPLLENQSENSMSSLNVISILLSRLKNSHSIDSSLVQSKSWIKLKQKEMYALGALLRGNKDALHHFNFMDGASALSQFYHAVASSGQDSAHLKDMSVAKLLNRVMILGQDLSIDMGEKNEYSKLYTDEGWCNMPMTILSNTSRIIQRQALENMIQLAPHCNFDKEELGKIHLASDPEIKDLFKKVFDAMV